jgi:hypothetical protein
VVFLGTGLGCLGLVGFREGGPGYGLGRVWVGSDLAGPVGTGPGGGSRTVHRVCCHKPGFSVAWPVVMLDIEGGIRRNRTVQRALTSDL